MSALDALIRVGGERVQEHADLGARTTYRVGGSVRALVTLRSTDDVLELAPLWAASGLGVVAIGNGSNLLVDDGEHEVVAVALEGEFSELRWHDEDERVIVEAGGGLALPVAARRLSREGVVGFEWAVGVPGTFGGAVAMNAGGHGSDMAAALVEVSLWHGNEVATWSKERLALGYRTSALERGDVVLGATLSLARGDADQAQERVSAIVRWRREHQPGGANGGSVFRNPAYDHAARLIEAAGCKGLRVGSAEVSDKHANFILADSNGLARDVFALMQLVREKVREDSGVMLVSEHRFVGFEVTP